MYLCLMRLSEGRAPAREVAVILPSSINKRVFVKACDFLCRVQHVLLSVNDWLTIGTVLTYILRHCPGTPSKNNVPGGSRTRIPRTKQHSLGSSTLRIASTDSPICAHMTEAGCVPKCKSMGPYTPTSFVFRNLHLGLQACVTAKRSRSDCNYNTLQRRHHS